MAVLPRHAEIVHDEPAVASGLAKVRVGGVHGALERGTSKWLCSSTMSEQLFWSVVFRNMSTVCGATMGRESSSAHVDGVRKVDHTNRPPAPK